jgi:hypothetical protein
VELDRAFGWLQATTIAKAISENEILFPWIESVHVLAIVLVVGTISIVDLRLLAWHRSTAQPAGLCKTCCRLLGARLESLQSPAH